MAREEEIIEASIDYQIATNPKCIAGEAFADFAHEMNVNQSFIEGAKWADKTMIEKAAKWLIKGGYFVNNTETIEEFRKAMEE